MSFNHAFLLKKPKNTPHSSGNQSQRRPQTRRRVTSDPCLPERLPTTGFIQREADSLAPQELVKQMLKLSMDENVSSDIGPEDVQQVPPEKSPTPRSPSYIRTLVRSMIVLSPSRAGREIEWSNLQPFEIMKAIEQKDLMFLMEVRDKAFPLLLQSSGGETPLVHAIRTGNKDVAIVLLGAFSRWVNYLTDDEVLKPQTQTQLKALRVGLKLAINEGLAASQNDLIASFMQTLVMSEGDKWVSAQAATVARALNAGTEGKPVDVAGSVVRKFATKELGKAEMIASLEDYIANATADLLVMGAWTNILQTVKAEPLPSYYFARDDRVYKAFIGRLDRNQAEIQRTCNKRLRWQISVLRTVLDGRIVTFRRKIELLSQQLDHGDGV